MNMGGTPNTFLSLHGPLFNGMPIPPEQRSTDPLTLFSATGIGQLNNQPCQLFDAFDLALETDAIAESGWPDSGFLRVVQSKYISELVTPTPWIKLPLMADPSRPDIRQCMFRGTHTTDRAPGRWLCIERFELSLTNTGDIAIKGLFSGDLVSGEPLLRSAANYTAQTLPGDVCIQAPAEITVLGTYRISGETVVVAVTHAPDDPCLDITNCDDENTRIDHHPSVFVISDNGSITEPHLIEHSNITWGGDVTIETEQFCLRFKIKSPTRGIIAQGPPKGGAGHIIPLQPAEIMADQLAELKAHINRMP